MRRILVDAARRKRALKHGGDRQAQHLVDIEAPEISDDVLALDEAIKNSLICCKPLIASLEAGRAG